ncbi:MAG: hypothetical protein Kow00108_00640 [Calditrichia bacterium]
MSIYITLNHDLAANKKLLRQLILRGAYNFRISASYFQPEDIKEAVRNIMALVNEIKDEITIIVDLPGAKRRLGQLTNKTMTIKKHQEYEFICGTNSSPGRKYIPIPDEDFVNDILIGDILTIKDGSYRLLIKDINYEEKIIKAEALSDFKLQSYYGYGFLKKKVPLPSFPAKNFDLIESLGKLDIKGFAISYIETPEQFTEIRSFIHSVNPSLQAIPKIETPKGIENFPALAESASELWFCRGDLLNFIRAEDLFQFEKLILDLSKNISSQLFIAGENLLGSLNSALPSRAEISHLGYLYESGIDGIVLSDETANVDNPIDIFLLAQKIERKYKKLRSSFLDS